MKQKPKIELLFKRLLLFLCSALIISCTQDDYIKDSHHGHVHGKPLIKVQKLNKKDNPLIIERLKENINEVRSLDFSLKSTTNMYGEIDYSEILQVIDKTGVTNYVLKIVNHPDDSQDIFHNLIVSEKNGEQDLSIIKYERQNNATELKDFEGLIRTQSFNFDASIDDPCDENEFNANLSAGILDPTAGSSAGATYPPPPSGGTTNPPSSGFPTNGGSGGGNTSGLNLSMQPITYQCNSCSFSAYSWENFSEHTDDNGTIYDFTIIITVHSETSNVSIDDNPCGPDGSIGVIDDDKSKKKECKKITEFLNDTLNASFKQKLQELSANSTLNLNYEKGATLSENETNLTLYQGEPDDPKFRITGIFPNKLKAFAHTHPAIGNDTLSIFSPADLIAIATWIRQDKLSDSFTAYLSTKKGTHYALTIQNPTKFLNFFFAFVMKGREHEITNDEMEIFSNSNVNSYNLLYNYFDPKNPNRKIKVTDSNNNALLEFLNFMEEADAGFTLFDASSTTSGESPFTKFRQLTLKNGQPYREDPCN